jgi:hypothetical protein
MLAPYIMIYWLLFNIKLPVVRLYSLREQDNIQ